MSVVPVGVETRAHPLVGTPQETWAESPQAVAMNAVGAAVIVFSSPNSPADDGTSQTGIWFRRVPANGNISSTTAVEVNVTRPGQQAFGSVAMAPDGSFVIVWSGNGTNTGGRPTDLPAQGATDGTGIFMRRYDAAGNFRDAGERMVNTTVPTGAGQDPLQEHPSVAMDADGNFVVVWTVNETSGLLNSQRNVFMRRYSSTGIPIDTTEVQVNTSTTQVERMATVAMNARGDFVVVWSAATSFNGDYDVIGRYFRKSDNQFGPVFVGALLGAPNDVYPSVDIANSGDFVITFTHSPFFAEDPTDLLGDNDVYFRRFSAPLGVAAGPQFKDAGDRFVSATNAAIPGAQRFSRVSVVPETGDFTIVWDGLGPATVEYNGDAIAEETIATGGGMFGQRFLANGTHFGNLFRVNTSLLGPQRLAGIAVRSLEDSPPSNHSLFVAWSGEGSQTLSGQDDGQGVFYQRYQRYSEFSPIADAGGPYSMLEGEPLQLDASESKVPAGRVIYSWDLNGDGDFSDASGIDPTVNWSDLVALGIQDDGEFVVRLHLEHDAGGLSDAESVLMVANVAPSASIEDIPDSVHVEMPFSLLAAAVDASPVDEITFIWHVTRDGQTLAFAAGETLTFTPVALGEFTVTLIARDDDLGATVAQLTLTAGPCVVLGDTDSDCSVGLTDLNNVRNNFGKSGPQVLGDADGNGVVDLIDLNAVRNNFGAGSDDNTEANALSHANPSPRKSKARLESSVRWPAVKAVEADVLFAAIGGEAILDLAKPRRYRDRARV